MEDPNAICICCHESLHGGDTRKVEDNSSQTPESQLNQQGCLCAIQFDQRERNKPRTEQNRSSVLSISSNRTPNDNRDIYIPILMSTPTATGYAHVVHVTPTSTIKSLLDQSRSVAIQNSQHVDAVDTIPNSTDCEFSVNDFNDGIPQMNTTTAVTTMHQGERIDPPKWADLMNKFPVLDDLPTPVPRLDEERVMDIPNSVCRLKMRPSRDRDGHVPVYNSTNWIL